MSVLVITTVPADMGAFDKVAADNADTMRRIADEARAKGAEHHWFADDGAGNLMIVDIWDTREHFEEFFASQPDIPKMMAQAGVEARPSTVSYRVMETPDAF